MKKIILTLLAFASLQTIALAQTFEGTLVENPPEKYQSFKEQWNKHVVFEFPIAKLYQYLQQGQNHESPVELKIGSEVFKFKLTENHVCSSDLTGSVIASNGIRALKTHDKNLTYKGNLQDKSGTVRSYVSENTFIATIKNENYHFQIQPLDHLVREIKESDLFVMTRRTKKDAERIKEKDLEIFNLDASERKRLSSTRSNSDDITHWLEFAAEVDYAFYNDYNQNIEDVKATIIARVNELDDLYQAAVDLSVKLVFINIYQHPNDPYHAITNGGPGYSAIEKMWDKVKSIYNGPMNCVRRDVVHLFTGRTAIGADGVAGGAGGGFERKTGLASICGTNSSYQAYIYPTLREAYAYGVSTNSRDFESWLTTAHELGHNFSLMEECTDTGTDYIMCGGNSCTCGDITPIYSDDDVTDIQQYIDGVNQFNYPPPTYALGGLGNFPRDICLTEPEQSDLDHNAAIQSEFEFFRENDISLALSIPNSEDVNTYNFGDPNFAIIQKVTVYDGGYLRVNNVGPTGFLDGPPTNQNLFTAETTTCGSNIVINNGGYFILGNDDGNVPATRKANVHIKTGSTVTVRDGGTLRLARGSQLIIEEGAELVIEDGAKINIWWSNSTIHIKGKLTVNGDFFFSGSGYFQFEKDHELELNAGHFTLHGQGDRFIQINEDAQLNIKGRLELRDGEVEYEDDAMINILEESEVYARSVVFRGIGEYGHATAIHGIDVNFMDFLFCDFENLFAAVGAFGAANDDSFVRSFFGEFNNCYEGFWVEDVPELFLMKNDFLGNGNSTSAIKVSNADVITVSSSIITGYNSSYELFGALTLSDIPVVNIYSTNIDDNRLGAILDNVETFTVSGGSISRSAFDTNPGGPLFTGIYVPSAQTYGQNVTNIVLKKGATIENWQRGIIVDRGGTSNGEIYGQVTMDCAKLINNTVGIRGQDVILHIDALDHCDCDDQIQYANPNTFYAGGNPATGNVLFDICYQEFGDISAVSARGNYWEDGLPDPSDEYYFRVTPPGNECFGNSAIPLILDDYVTVPPDGCNNEPPGPDPDPDDKDKIAATLELEIDLQLSPNPATSEVIAMWDKSVNSGQLIVYDGNGTKIESKVLQQETQVTLDVSNWQKGTYFIGLVSNEASKFEKLIVQ